MQLVGQSGPNLAHQERIVSVGDHHTAQEIQFLDVAQAQRQNGDTATPRAR